MDFRLHYIPACPSPPANKPPTYKPTLEECRLLASPVENFLSLCNCYDMLSTSTQVVVLDIDAPLAVAFIAAQETRVQSCVLWDTQTKAFIGVLTSTDYIKILLYGESRPEEAAAIPTWSIRRWRTVQEKLGGRCELPADIVADIKKNDSVFLEQYNKDIDAHGGGRPKLKGQSYEVLQKIKPPALVSSTTDTSLSECLRKMNDNSVRRIVALAEKESESFSVVSMMDVEQIVEFLGVIFFHVERVGGSFHRAASVTMMRTPSQTSNVNNASMNTNPITAPASGAAPSSTKESGGGTLLNSARSSNSSSNITSRSSSMRLLEENAAAAVAANNATGTGANPSAGTNTYTIGDMVLSPALTALLVQIEELAGKDNNNNNTTTNNNNNAASGGGGGGGGSGTANNNAAANAVAAGEAGLVGPYNLLFDMPFSCTPPSLAQHRTEPIVVLLDHKLQEALVKMLYFDVESIAVVNNYKDLIIIDVISRSDLLRMEDQGVYDTKLTIREALASKLKEKIFVFYETDSLRDIFAHFVQKRVKELFLIDPQTGRLQGQMNVAEFVFFLVMGVTAHHKQLPATKTKEKEVTAAASK